MFVLKNVRKSLLLVPFLLVHCTVIEPAPTDLNDFTGTFLATNSCQPSDTLNGLIVPSQYIFEISHDEEALVIDNLANNFSGLFGEAAAKSFLMAKRLVQSDTTNLDALVWGSGVLLGNDSIQITYTILRVDTIFCITNATRL